MQNNTFYAHAFSDDDFASQSATLLCRQPENTRILMIGDILGRPGRNILRKVLPLVREKAQVDFVIANGENLAGGFGITEKIFHEVLAMGVNAVTMGNHWKDKADVHIIREKHPALVLPQNLPEKPDARTVPSFFLPSKKKYIHVINLMGNFAMKEEYLNPFEALQGWKEDFTAKAQTGMHIIVADIHAEATSEKQAAAWLYDGILTSLVGTHTHVPTADERLTDKGTAFLTDVGMTGAYESVVGMNRERAVARLSRPAVRIAHEVASEELWFCAFLVEANAQTGRACACHRLQYRSEKADGEMAGGRWVISSVIQG